jgi:hypothetical protein
LLKEKSSSKLLERSQRMMAALKQRAITFDQTHPELRRKILSLKENIYPIHI